MESNKEHMPSQDFKHYNYYSSSLKDDKLPNMGLYDFLYERNKNHMDDVGITFANKKITYEELHTRIEEYAKALYNKGVRSGDLIAVASATTPEVVYLSYALHKLGAIEVPINPTNNSYKIMRDLEIVKPKMFIGINECYKNFKNATKGSNIDYVIFPAVNSVDNNLLHLLYGLKQIVTGNALLDMNHSLKHMLSDGKNIEEYIKGEYDKDKTTDIIFTGGSSGVHKGVALNENGLNSVVKSLDYLSVLKPGDIFMENLPQFMAFGKMSMHYALCGNTNVELTIKAYPQDFVDELLRIKPNGVFGGPVHWETLLNNPKLKNVDLSFLKQPVSGGEQLKVDHEKAINRELLSHGGPSKIWNGLGMTEMWAPVCLKKDNITSDSSLGVMLPFTNAKICDVETGEELPYNESGMLYVTGPGMMKEYYKNKEETEKSLIKDENGVTWYITGDLAKIKENGEVYFVGRNKRSFVCGVDNIYPEQIENLICSLPEVKEAIVTKIPDDEFQFLPKYHIQLSSNNVDIKELQNKIYKLICNTLGESAAPRFFEYYEESLPHTPNGKLDPKPLQAKDLEEHNKTLSL